MTQCPYFHWIKTVISSPETRRSIWKMEKWINALLWVPFESFPCQDTWVKTSLWEHRQSIASSNKNYDKYIISLESIFSIPFHTFLIWILHHHHHHHHHSGDHVLSLKLIYMQVLHHHLGSNQIHLGVGGINQVIFIPASCWLFLWCHVGIMKLKRRLSFATPTPNNPNVENRFCDPPSPQVLFTPVLGVWRGSSATRQAPTSRNLERGVFTRRWTLDMANKT